MKINKQKPVLFAFVHLYHKGTRLYICLVYNLKFVILQHSLLKPDEGQPKWGRPAVPAPLRRLKLSQINSKSTGLYPSVPLPLRVLCSRVYTYAAVRRCPHFFMRKENI